MVIQNSDYYYIKEEINNKIVYFWIIDKPGLSDTRVKEDDEKLKKEIISIISNVNIKIKGVLFLSNFQMERLDETISTKSCKEKKVKNNAKNCAVDEKENTIKKDNKKICLFLFSGLIFEINIPVSSLSILEETLPWNKYWVKKKMIEEIIE